MKLHTILASSLLAIGLVAPALSAAAETPPSLVPVTPTSPVSDDQLSEAAGWLFVKSSGVADLLVGREENAQLAKGIMSGVEGKDSPFPPKAIGPALDRFLDYRVKVFEARFTAGFFARLRENKDVVALPSGMFYQIYAAGSGAPPKPGDTVRIHYGMALPNGGVFASSLATGDSSEPRGGEPVEFTLRDAKGFWAEGLRKIAKGGKIRLYLPPPLAFGDERDTNFVIPPFSAVVMDIALVDIAPTGSAGSRGLSQALKMLAAPGNEGTRVPPVPVRPTSNFTEGQLIEEYGRNAAKRSGQINELLITPEQVARLAKGVETAIEGKDLPFPTEEIDPLVLEFLKRRHEAYKIERNAAFFAKLRANENIVVLPNGIFFEILEKGSGAPPKPADPIRAHYRFSLVDGKVISSSDEPIEAVLSDLTDIWAEGLRKIGKGGRIKLYVPPPLAFSPVGSFELPSFTPVVFELNLVDIGRIK